MESVSIILTLLLAVVVSAAISRMLPVSIPAPLVQIGLGAAVGLAASVRVEVDPELFLLVFLPPLLFLDGWRIPKDSLLKDASTIVELALGLVLLTVASMGFFIHWMIPAMPLPVAFAVAAVVSPTDPIAVSAIAARAPIPKRMMHILEGESLLNDASGLVCLRFAIAAALTGSFSFAEATVSFLWAAGGGLVTGVLVTTVVTRAKAWVSAHFGEDTGSQILISVLIPFASYLLAEHLRCSGILAAVSAGVTMSFAEISRQALAATRMRSNSVWDTIQFALNGIMFVLLGEQLPAILSATPETVRLIGHSNPWWLGGYVLAIAIGLAAIRFAWVWTTFRLTLFRRRAEVPFRSPDWRLIAAMSFAGVRGAITLAGVLSVPLAMNDGFPFPARDLAIFLAAGVIIVSLVAASVGLPIVLQGLTMPVEPSKQAEEDRARVLAAEAAIRGIERAQHRLAEGRSDADVYAAAGARLMDVYRERIEIRSQQTPEGREARRNDRIERDLRLAGLRAERDEIFRIARDRQIDNDTAQKLIREIDLLEARYKA